MLSRIFWKPPGVVEGELEALTDLRVRRGSGRGVEPQSVWPDVGTNLTETSLCPFRVASTADRPKEITSMLPALSSSRFFVALSSMRRNTICVGRLSSNPQYLPNRLTVASSADDVPVP